MSRKACIGLVVLIGMITGADYSPGQPVAFLTEPRARAVVVLRLEIPRLATDSTVHVKVHPEGGEYSAVSLFSPLQNWIDGSRFETVSRDKAAFVAPVVGSLTMTSIAPIFGAPGIYSFQVEYSVPCDGYPSRRAVAITEDVQVLECSQHDLGLFERVEGDSRADLMRAFGFDGLPEAHTKHFTALDILGYVVLQIAQDPLKQKPTSEDLLVGLALAFPESSYAPYLAYYAAGGYLYAVDPVLLHREHGVEIPDARVREFSKYKDALRALEFTVKHADPFLKPFAMFRLVRLKAMGDDLKGAEDILNTVQRDYADRPRVLRLAEKAREELVELVADRNHKQDEAE